MNITKEINIKLLPDLAERHDKWKRADTLLTNDEDDFVDAPFFIPFPNESDASKNDRKRYFATGFINPTDQLVTAPGDILFKNGYNLGFGSDSSQLKTFSENVMIGDMAITMEEYLEQYTLPGLRAFGTVFTVVDKPAIVPRSREEERAVGMPFLTNIHPLDVQNYCFVNGKLIWFAYKSKLFEPWMDPTTTDESVAKPVICLWTQNQFIMIGNDNKVVGEKSFDHNFGFCPVVIQGAYLARPTDILGQCAFDKTSNMLIMFNNQLHLALNENFKFGNSLLLMHEESMSATNIETDKTGSTKLKKQGQGNVLTWSGTQKPEYLTKDQAVIDSALKLANLYWDKAIENEQDLKSLAQKGVTGETVQESGFAKMIDREPIEANLRGLANDGERWTAKVFEYTAKMLAIENDATFQFNKSFDLRSAKQAFEDIKSAKSVNLGRWTITGMKELYKTSISKFISDPKLAQMATQEIEDNAETIRAEDQSAETLRNEMADSFRNAGGADENGDNGNE